MQQQKPQERKAYGVKEFATAWGLSRVTVYRMFERGELRKIKAGTRTLIAADSPWLLRAQQATA